MKILLVNENLIYRYQNRYYTERTWPESATYIIEAAGEGTLFAPVADAPEEKCARLTPLVLRAGRIAPSPFFGGSLGELKGRVLGRSGFWSRAAAAIVSSHDVVLCRIPSPHLRYIAAACSEAPKPLMLMVSGPRVEGSIGVHRVPKVFRPMAAAYLRAQDREQKRIARDATAVFTAGAALAQEWSPFGRVLQWQDHYLPEGMYCWRPDTCLGSSISILRVCDLSEPRGIELLLKAFRLLAERHNSVRLDLVGGGDRPYVEGLKRLTRDLGVSNCVAFHGWCNRVAVQKLMRSADIHVITSLADGVPRSIAEGAANCVPLVTTGAGGIREAVKDGETAVIVNDSTPAAVADGVTRVLADATLRRRLIANAYNDALSYHAVRKSRALVSTISELLKECLGRGCVV
jgi:hypothetical protein